MRSRYLIAYLNALCSNICAEGLVIEIADGMRRLGHVLDHGGGFERLGASRVEQRKNRHWRVNRRENSGPEAEYQIIAKLVQRRRVGHIPRTLRTEYYDRV